MCLPTKFWESGTAQNAQCDFIQNTFDMVFKKIATELNRLKFIICTENTYTVESQ